MDPARTHADLVDERFVRAALAKVGGPGAFGLARTLVRKEVVAP
jgi:NitT/TauT family transport system substrate-binding protein